MARKRVQAFKPQGCILRMLVEAWRLVRKTSWWLETAYVVRFESVVGGICIAKHTLTLLLLHLSSLC